MTLDYLDMDEEQEKANIMVIGVGGGGGNAVKYMYDVGIHNIYFMVCNTDAQALRRSPVPLKIQFGQGLGAGNDPEKGRLAALEGADEIREQLIASGVEMVFITAGMGGGTGTGAAPVIAQIASELGLLSVAIVTIPFRYEGPRRLKQAEEGLNEIKKYVDSLLVIDNENICKIYGDLGFSEAFGKADDILAIAAKGIAETVTKEHKVNVDFADVRTTMTNSGIAILGYAECGIDEENVAIRLTEQALLSPLLNKNNVLGATKVLVNISWSNKELKMSEVAAISEHVSAAAGNNPNIIWGAGVDSSLAEGRVSVIIIATCFDNQAIMELGEDITAQNWGKVHIDSPLESVVSQDKEIEVLDNVVEQQVINEPTSQAQSEAIAEQNAEVEYLSLGDEEPNCDDKHEMEHLDNNDDDDIHLVESVATPLVAKEEDKSIIQHLVDSSPEVNVAPKVENVTYTVDDLENIPAYKRRQIMDELERLTSQDQHPVEKVDLELE